MEDALVGCDKLAAISPFLCITVMASDGTPECGSLDVAASMPHSGAPALAVGSLAMATLCMASLSYLTGYRERRR